MLNFNPSLNDLLNEAISLWANVVNISVENWDDAGLIEELNKSRELDETGLTTWMMIRGLTENHLKAVQYSAYDIIFNSVDIKPELNRMADLYNILENSSVVELIENFNIKIRETAGKFKFNKLKELEALLADKYELAIVRRDAFKSLAELEVHQFSQGLSDKIALGINPQVFEMWNMNSLIKALASQRIPGITIVLIRDPQALNSFFVVAVKNGENITIFTDKEREVHPGQKNMRRRPDRLFEKRATRNWFPYSLVDIEVSEDQRRLYANARTQLVPTELEAVPLTTISELEPEEFVWIMLFGECIREKYWKQNYHTPELSYTGEMVVYPQALTEGYKSLVKKGVYTPLEVSPLINSDITTEKLINLWPDPPLEFTKWMVERYGHLVQNEVLNVVGEQKLLEIRETNTEIEKYTNNGGELAHLDPQVFGTKDTIEFNRKWAARMNQAKLIQYYALEEYNKTKTELCEWYAAKIKERTDFFANAVAKGECIGPGVTMVDCTTGEEYTGIAKDRIKLISKNLVAIKEEADIIHWLSYRAGSVILNEFQRAYHTKYFCIDNPGIVSSVFAVFTPTCPEALALFLGISEEELPWQMKNWYSKDYRPYTGNCILDNIDPIDWTLNNPWSEMRFEVGIAFSKRGLARRKKLLKL